MNTAATFVDLPFTRHAIFYQGGNSSEALPSTHATLKAISPQSSGWNPLQLNNFLHLVSVPPNPTPPTPSSSPCSGGIESRRLSRVAAPVRLWPHSGIKSENQSSKCSFKFSYSVSCADLLPEQTSAAAAAPDLYYVSDDDSELIGELGWLLETITSVKLTLRSCVLPDEKPKCWYLHTERKNRSIRYNYTIKRLFYGCKDVKSRRIFFSKFSSYLCRFCKTLNYWGFLQFTPLYLDINIYFMALWWWFNDTLVVRLKANHHFSPRGSQ